MSSAQWNSLPTELVLDVAGHLDNDSVLQLRLADRATSQKITKAFEKAFMNRFEHIHATTTNADLELIMAILTSPRTRDFVREVTLSSLSATAPPRNMTWPPALSPAQIASHLACVENRSIHVSDDVVERLAAIFTAVGTLPSIGRVTIGSSSQMGDATSIEGINWAQVPRSIFDHVKATGLLHRRLHISKFLSDIDSLDLTILTALAAAEVADFNQKIIHVSIRDKSMLNVARRKHDTSYWTSEDRRVFDIGMTEVIREHTTSLCGNVGPISQSRLKARAATVVNGFKFHGWLGSSSTRGKRSLSLSGASTIQKMVIDGASSVENLVVVPDGPRAPMLPRVALGHLKALHLYGLAEKADTLSNYISVAKPTLHTLSLNRIELLSGSWEAVLRTFVQPGFALRTFVAQDLTDRYNQPDLLTASEPHVSVAEVDSAPQVMVLLRHVVANPRLEVVSKRKTFVFPARLANTTSG